MQIAIPRRTVREKTNFQRELISCDEIDVEWPPCAIYPSCGVQCTAYTIRFSFVRLSVQWTYAVCGGDTDSNWILVSTGHAILIRRVKMGATMGSSISCPQSRGYDCAWKWATIENVNSPLDRIDLLFFFFFLFNFPFNFSVNRAEKAEERGREGDPRYYSQIHRQLTRICANEIR